MGRPLKVGYSVDFANVNNMSALHNEMNDCSVKAFALISGIPYSQVREAFEKGGRKPRQPTYLETEKIALEILGIKKVYFDLEPIMRRMARPDGSVRRVTTYSPRRFPKAWEGVPPLVMYVSRHMCCYRDGVVHDWSVNSSLRVYAAYTVEKM